MGPFRKLISSVASGSEHGECNPTDDLLTALVHLEVDGALMDDDAITSVLWNLVGGGLDTTTSLTALSLLHLAEHPDQRRRLIDDPSLLPVATEEFLRYFSVNETLSRTVATPTELGGQRLEPGDRVLFSWLSANRDASRFEDADETVLDRTPNPHVAFGVGAHRCIGMHVARMTFQVLMREALPRLGDYEAIRPVARYAGNPTLNGLVRLPVRFTPGKRLGPRVRPF